MAQTGRYRGTVIAVTLAVAGCAGPASDPVRVVGSSTIFPFAAKTAEIYSDRTGTVMVVEQTGSGGGHKLFCSGDPSIDATTSSRRRKPEEAALCEANGVTDTVELRLGYDGIVLARAAEAGPGRAPHGLTERQIYLALARTLPTSASDCTPRPNDHARWSDIDPDLPDSDIAVHGPPPTSGTRDAFVETAMEAGARSFPCLRAMERRAPGRFRTRAHMLREDGRWIDAGENDAALIRTLRREPGALGVFGFSFLDQGAGRVEGLTINGVMPSPDTIRSGTYPVVRDLYLYFHAEGRAELAGYALEFTSDEAAGPGGYLESIGLVPLPAPERARMRREIERVLQASEDPV